MKKTFELRQERNFGAKISGSFEFIKQNFAGLAKPILYIALPVGLLAGYFLSEYFSVMISSTQRNYDPYYMNEIINPIGMMLNYFGLLATSIIGYSLIICIIFSYISLYDEDKDRNISYSRVFGKLRKRFWRFFGYNVVYGLMFGLILVVAAGICIGLPVFLMIQSSPAFVILFLLMLGAFVMVILFFTAFMYVLQNTIFFENLSVGQTLSRTFALMKNHWWETIGLWLVSSIILNILSFIFIIPLYIIMIMNMSGIELGETGKILTIAVSMLSTFASFMIVPLLQVPLSIQYFNLVERKDGTGLIGQIEKIGQTRTEPDEDE